MLNRMVKPEMIGRYCSTRPVPAIETADIRLDGRDKPLVVA